MMQDVITTDTIRYHETLDRIDRRRALVARAIQIEDIQAIGCDLLNSEEINGQPNPLLPFLQTIKDGREFTSAELAALGRVVNDVFCQARADLIENSMATGWSFVKEGD